MEVYPHLHMVLPDGIHNIIDSLMSSYTCIGDHPAPHNVSTFMDDVMTVIDYCVNSDESGGIINATTADLCILDLANKQLHSVPFYSFLIGMYNYVDSIFLNILGTNDFIVDTFKYTDRLGQLIIDVRFNGQST